jgi:hypothetical protein
MVIHNLVEILRPPSMAMVMHKTLPMVTNTPTLSFIVPQLLFIPTPTPPTQASTMPVRPGEGEQRQRKKGIPRAHQSNRVVYVRSCLINGGKRSALGDRILMGDTKIRKAGDKLDGLIRLNELYLLCFSFIHAYKSDILMHGGSCRA